VLLANHGPIVSAPILEGASYAIEELEETAKLFLLLRDAKPRPLYTKLIAELVHVFELDPRLGEGQSLNPPNEKRTDHDETP
jgi:3-dehydro-4-phosphotetronate decarboxylase